jgi:hypothetical protein
VPALRRALSWNEGAPAYVNDFFARNIANFALVQQYVVKLAMTAVDYPPMQDPVSFNLDAVKKTIQDMIKNHQGQ